MDQRMMEKTFYGEERSPDKRGISLSWHISSQKNRGSKVTRNLKNLKM